MTSIKTRIPSYLERRGGSMKGAINMDNHKITRISPGSVALDVVGLDSSALITAALLGTGTPSSATILRGDRVWTAISGLTVSNSDMLDGLHAAAFSLVNAQLWGDVYGYLPYPRIRPEVSIFSNITGTFSSALELRNPAQLILAQSFPVGDLSLPSLRRGVVKLKRTGTLSGDIWLEKRAVITATKLPAGPALVTSNKIAAQDIASGAATNYTFEFPINAYSVTTNEDVAICLNGDYTGDASNYIAMYYKSGAITGYVMSYYDGAAWQESSSVNSFYVDLYGGDAGSSVSLDNLVAGNGRLKEANLPQGTLGYPLLGTGALKPAYGTDLATGVTIGSAYIYRAGGTDVPVTDGGTGLSACTIGQILYGSGVNQLAMLSKALVGAILTNSGSVGAEIPYWLPGDTSNTRKFLRGLSVGSVATAPVWDSIAQADVSGLTTASSPTFVGLTVSGLTVAGIVQNNASGALSTLAHTEWTTYTPTTITGYASGVGDGRPTDGLYLYKIVGKMCYIQFSMSWSGTAQSGTTVTFSLPFAEKTRSGFASRTATSVYDSSVWQTHPGMVEVNYHNHTGFALLGKSMSGTGGFDAGAGTRTVFGEFFYELA